MQFDDPVAAGATLVRVAIQSADYVPGVSGWIIKRNGDTEFNSGSFRSDVIVTAPDGTRISIRPSNYPAGGVISMRPPTATWNENADEEGEIRASIAGTNYGYLTLQSPILSEPTKFGGRLELYSEPVDGVPHTGMQYSRPQGRFNFTDLRVDFDLYVGPDITPMGRGIFEIASASSNSGAIGTTETIIMTTASRTWESNRAWRVDLSGSYVTSATSQSPAWRIRKGATLAGGTVGLGYRDSNGAVASGTYGLNMCSYMRTGATAVTTDLSLTLASVTGTTTFQGSTGGRHLVFTDIGPASRFPDAYLLS